MNAYAILFSLLFVSAPAFTQTIKADDIIGTWIAGENKARVQIYKSGNKYHGRITWLKEPTKDGVPKTDKNNPDPKLRNTPIVGLIVLRNFVFDDGEWLSGNIYDPSYGKEYSCKISMPKPNTLKVRGYFGISLFGRTEVWKRA